jgi:glycosyltransferase involved in cell wall biosynthesis
VRARISTDVPRVLHVDAAREWRGGQNQARLLLAGLAARGAEQALACRPDSRLAREAGALGVRVVPLRWRVGLDPAAVIGLAREIGAGGWEVVHAHSSHALQASVLALALAGGRSALVGSRRLDFPLRSPAVWRRADLVLAVSGPVRDVLVAGGLEPGRIRVVHDGVDPGTLEPPLEGRLRSAARAAPGDLLVGAAGALVGHKDHATLLRAAAVVARERSDARFIIAGEGPERPALERLAGELGLSERLAMPGHVADVARSLGDLDLFVMSSSGEGLGSASLEAMAAGVPVVLTTAGGLAEVAGDVLAAVAPGEPDALARAILELLSDRDARERAAAAGRERAAAFSADAMADGTLAAYRAATRRAREEARLARAYRLGRERAAARRRGDR